MADHTTLVESATNLYKNLGHRIQDVTQISKDVTHIRVMSKKGGLWIVTCDSRSVINKGHLSLFLKSTVSAKPRRVAVITSGKFTPDAIEFVAGKPIELIDLKTLRLYLAQSERFVRPSEDQSALEKHDELEPARTDNNVQQKRKCPFCAEEIQVEAVVCRFCGRDLVKALYSIDEEKKDPRKKRKSSLLAFVLITMIFLVCICSGVLFALGDEPEQTGASGNKAEVMCEKIIESQLVSPSTAEFADDVYIRTWTLGKDSGQYDAAFRVKGWVDSQNRFGAVIRNYYTCDISYEGGEWTDRRNWTLLDLTISE